MRKPYILPFLQSVAPLIAVSLLFSCSNIKNNETALTLQKAEAFMNDRPDSALTLIQTIDKETLTSKELRARHALLISQAFDKNYIDLQSDSIIAPAVKFFEKSKVKALTLVFGEASESQVKRKMSMVNGFRGSKKVYVLGNVETPEAVMELKKLNVDGIYTPYTETIGAELVKRFNVKSVNLR